VSLLLAALATGASPVDEPPYDCETTAVQFELNECARAEYERADARLNQQWQVTLEVFRSRSPEDVERLRAAQRAWISFRDTQCDAEHPFDLGVSLDKMLNINCRRALTEARTSELAQLARDG